MPQAARYPQTAVRLVAALVVVSAAIATGRQWAPWILLLLAVDFGIRAFGRPVHSPLATAGRAIVNLMGLPPRPVDARPKRFAGRIGLVLSVLTAGLFAVGAQGGATIVAGVRILCAFLEASLVLCVGCKVYSLLPARVARAVAR